MKLSNIFSDSKFYSKYLLLGARRSGKCLALGALFLAFAGLASCTDELVPNEGPNIEEPTKETEYLYFSLNFKEATPVGSRAGESKDGTEGSLAKESNIENVSIIIADLKKSEGSEFTGDYYYNSDDKQTFRVITVANVNKNDKFKSSEGIEYSALTDNNNGTYTVVGKAEKSDFEKLYAGTPSTPIDLYVFVIANNKNNPQVDPAVVGRNIQREIEANTTGWSESITKGIILEAKDDFLMSSEKAYPVSISWNDLVTAVPEDENTPHYYPDKAFNLNSLTNAIPIHRIVARIDMNWKNTKFKIDENGTSTVVEPNSPGVHEPVTGAKYTVTLDGAAIVNMSKHYMLFQETGKPAYTSNQGGTSTTVPAQWNIFGPEKDGMGDETEYFYVRDPFGTEKEDDHSGNYFFSSLSGIDPTNTEIKNHSDYTFRTFEEMCEFETTAERTEYDNKYSDQETKNEDYGIFQYVLPNSVHNASKQHKDNSTGVIYRAEIGDNENITTALNKLTGEVTRNDVYAYKNEIYGDYATFRTYALNEENKSTYETLLFNLIWESYANDLVKDIAELTEKIKSETDADKKTELEEEKEALEMDLSIIKEEHFNFDKSRVDPDRFRDAALKNGVRTYSAVKDSENENKYHYYCYYYYWIHHNDNGLGNVMAPMEYAIVRNYVYKLSVNKIFDLGYPEIPTDDPDPLDPKEEVEKNNLRMEVLTRILPWGVRTDDTVILE